MHVGKNYRVREFLYWTRREIYLLTIMATIPTLLYQLAGWKWIAIPWIPIALIGTAAAFIIGFKNTQTYNRLWEARQIWGAIVNASRSWGILTKDSLKDDPDASRQLIHRHLAWLTALRFQLRTSQSWENIKKPHFQEYLKKYRVPEWESTLDAELANYINKEELTYILGKKNRATQLIALQSTQLGELKKKGVIDNYVFIEMEKRLADLYDQQGKCERIKNFPYPRQFASVTLFFVWLFVSMLPFAILNEFQKLGNDMTWLSIPFSVIVSWVFTVMDKVGEATENPFEGGANDIPMAALSRTIEIDLRDMLNESDLPLPIKPVNNILM